MHISVGHMDEGLQKAMYVIQHSCERRKRKLSGILIKILELIVIKVRNIICKSRCLQSAGFLFADNMCMTAAFLDILFISTFEVVTYKKWQ
jgi:hypothetical protein